MYSEYIAGNEQKLRSFRNMNISEGLNGITVKINAVLRSQRCAR
jgi:hypothetical protein